MMRRVLALISLLALTTSIAEVSAAGRLPSSIVLTVTSGGVERDFILHAQPTDTPKPLVLIFHGGGGSAQFMVRRSSAFADLLLTRGYAVAFMNGSSHRDGRNFRTWNGGHCCAHAMTTKIDEGNYIDQAIAAIAAHTPVDRSRIFLMGHSNGGMVTYRWLATLRTKVRGIVVISSAMFADQPAIPQGTSAFLTHTHDDNNVAFNASFAPKQKRAWDAPPLPFLEAEARMAQLLDCDNPNEQRVADGVIKRDHTCTSGAELTVVVSETGGHEWPKSIPGFSLEGAILMFLDHQR
ncbi:MAG: alpha/beta fold hydrolase [Nitrospira sp.]|nr:alpha/beta fold hydrolase [Nitrospira sp.]